MKKKYLEISSFYICVPQIIITSCTVPEIWCTTDRRMDRWTEKVTYRGGSPGNNPEEVNVWQSDVALPRDFFLKFYFDLKMSKRIFKQGYLSISKCHLPNKMPFQQNARLSALFLFFQMLPLPFFCFSRCCPMILNYSLVPHLKNQPVIKKVVPGFYQRSKYQ